ncbi:gliding motility-associated C-terminal domain-containing protein, partial [uncultured Chryseobacterium sp.]|uniref:DUF7948 domain-containing protein n=1 Tax=uncultured Chryseobacterium sp. TaxID=259322 RepID=UPI00261453E4
MKKILFLVAVGVFCLFQSQKKHSSNEGFYFYENKGQIIDQNGKQNSEVKYLFHSAGLNVQLRSGGFSYDIYEIKKTTNINSSKFIKNRISEGSIYHNDEFIYEKFFHRIDIEFMGSNKDASIIAEGKSPDYDNFYNIPSQPKGISNIHRYQKVSYKNIYPNIDLVFFKPNDTLKPIEYNFIINPGGKVSDIKMKFKGAPALMKKGKLTMKVRFGEIYENIPNSWIQGDKKENINVNFKDLGDQIFGFDAMIETSDKTIVIDPVPTRIWGSYAGGYGDDYGKIKTDIQSTGYLFGGTNSTINFATSGTHQQNVAGSSDAFLMKITKNGQKVWGTYYGFNQNDFFNDVDFDENLNIYTGGTVQRGAGNEDIVVVKFNSNGGLVFQKELVSSWLDKLYTVSYNQNHVYIGGDAMSSDFPTVNAFQPTKATPGGMTDGILASLDAMTGNVDWATYFGKADGSTSIFQIMSSSGDLEIIAATRSQNIPMINPFQSNFSGITDGLYLKFSKTGNSLLRSSYYGNTGQDVVRQGRIVNNILILPGEYSTSSSNAQPGIWRVNLITNAITKSYFTFQYMTQLMSYTDLAGNIFFSGLASVNQTDIATPNAYMTTTGPYVKAFMIKYDANDVKQWGTFYGGNGGTQLGVVTKDNEDYIYFTGMSSNNTTGIATPGTFQQQGGHPSNDIFIAKFKDCTSAVTITSNSPVCINSIIQLNATSGAATYNWTGPNGFTSTQQNPTIPNATAAHSGVYTCQITGLGDCDGSFVVNVVVGDTVAPVPDSATLPDITGNCNTVVSTFPTATDNCAGTITATTTDPLSYTTSGTHVIHWTYNDGNGNTTTQNQNVIISPVALPTTANLQQTFCATSQPKISDIQITGQNIKWYDAGGNVLAMTTPLTNGQTYYATQTVNGCESGQRAINITVNTTPKPTGNTTQDFCASSDPKLSSLAVAGTALQYYDGAGNILPSTTALVHGQTYYVTQTLNGCESEKLAIAVTLSTNNVPAHNYSETFCNTTIGSSMVVNLHSYEDDLIANPSSYIFIYTDDLGNPILNPSNYTLNIGATVINVKVLTPDGCFAIVRLTLTLNPKPIVALPETVEFCQGKIVTLDAGSGFTSYLWSTGATTQTITISTPGNYSVTVKNNFGCEATDNVQASYSVLAEIVSINVTNNSATIILSASGNYEYSLDNLTWLDSNTFNNLEMGEYIVYVRTKGGCIIGQKPFSIFNIPNAITPNNDGRNDTWRIAGLENYTGSEVNVYDRKGIPVFKHTMNKQPLNWDGKLN